MDIKTYQTENSPLNAPISIEQEQDERGNMKWKGICATALTVMMLVSYRAGYVSNAVALRGRSSLVVSEQNSAIMEILTGFIGAAYPPLLEAAIQPFDPVDLGGDWSQTVSINVPGCPSAVDVKFDLGSITGLSSFDLQGLTLEDGKYKCEKSGWIGCTEGSFKGTWSEKASIRSLKAEASASLVGDTACLGVIVETELTGSAALNDPQLAMELSAEGTLGDYVVVPTSAVITSAAVESIDVEFGTLKTGISFSAWGKDVAGFEESFEDFIADEIEIYIEDVIKSTINDQLGNQLPLELP